MIVLISINTKIYNEYILPVITYEAKTWVLTMKMVHKIKIQLRAIRRKMQEIDTKNNKWIRQKTKDDDKTIRITSLKQQDQDQPTRGVKN